MRRAVLPTLLVCLLIPASATAAGRDVVRDCTDNGRIDNYHSQQDYRDALKNLNSDVDEYTDCRAVIEAAKRRDSRRPDPSSGGGAGGSGGGGGGGFSGGGIAGGFDTPIPPIGEAAPATPASPAESSALQQAASGAAAPVTVAGKPITPGDKGITEAALRNALPGPLLIVVILFGLGALAMTLSGARARGIHAPAGFLRVFDRAFPRRA